LKSILLTAFVLTFTICAEAKQICGVSVSKATVRQVNVKGETTGSIDQFTGTIYFEIDRMEYISLIPLTPESLTALEEAARYKVGVKPVCLKGSMYSPNNFTHIVYILEATF